ncbi:MAG TPA: hemolysin family protein [Candidatus Acidoferrales bacterium]|nr:hemolysin family protein [Candidatus Acidoferrales bacterium]
MEIFLHTLGVLGLALGLVVFAYLDRVYREMGRAPTRRIREHIEQFEAEVEPRLHLDRARANLAFSMLARLWLVAVAVETARGVVFFVPGRWEAAVEMVLFLSIEVAVAMHLIPSILISRASGRWIAPFVPIVRFFVFLIWPIQATVALLISFLRVADEPDESEPEAEQQAIEALVEAATEEGILEHDEARLIEQVVEFSDKRVRDVMTPRPDVVAIPASATLEDLRRLIIEKKFSRIPVYEKNLDDIAGIVVSRDILTTPDSEASRRTVREITRPALFVPETKPGSELLKEMQRKSQQMAVVIDEYGMVAGIVTVEDLVEEIVGEIGEEDRSPAPDVVREASGSLVLRGSVPIEKLKELFGDDVAEDSDNAGAATLAGLLNSVAGHVPAIGEKIDYDGLQFEILEANQRKVLRLRARRASSAAQSRTQ